MNTAQHQMNIDLARVMHKPLPRAWAKVAGILHSRAKAMQKHVATVRQEWR